MERLAGEPPRQILDAMHCFTFSQTSLIRVVLALSLLTAVSPVAGAGSPAGVRATVVPFELVRHKILLPVSVNGSPAYDFVLDTGSPVMLVADPELAAPMRLDLENHNMMLNGAGKGRPPEASMARTATVAIETGAARVELPDQPIFVLSEDPGFGNYLGVEGYGIIGRSLFESYVVEIDFERRRLVVHDQESYVYRGSGEVVPIRIVGGHPHCDGTVVLPGGERRTLDLVVDSGAGSALTLIENPREGLAAPTGAVSRRIGRGLNGEIRGAFVRLGRLELGSLELPGVVAAFAPRRSGIAPNAQANLGAEILRRFRVIFDYSRRRMILEPSNTFAEPFDIDMSGLVLRAEGLELDQLIIEQVREGSPAALVGIEAGDRLVTLDGRQMNLEEAVETLRQRDGYRIPLTVDRAGKLLEKQLTLKRDI